MPQFENLKKQIFKITSPDEFNALALRIFHYQYKNNSVYQKFADNLSVNVSGLNHYTQIPFLPVEFFKYHKVVSGKFEPEVVFTSSGTTGALNSRYFVKELSLYEDSFLRTFDLFFGKPEDYIILALLPSYLEHKGSSLVYMAEKLIVKSGHRESGFYLHDYEKLTTTLKRLQDESRKVILLGVTYALLDLAEKYPLKFPGLILMETGGMKGQRKEMVREELHETLKKAFQINMVYSEYGMTELFSQAYSKGYGKFHTPPWMKVVIRDTNDPLTLLPEGKSGGINIIDLANIHSCSFLATQDLGKINPDGSFEVLGRFDDSDVRGCNLMVQ